MLLLPLVAACASPTATPTSVPTTTVAATTTLAPRLAFPPETAVSLEAGRYSSQPPFDVAFSFAIPVEGWGTAHHHGEFLDVMQPVALGVSPTRWVAFARPQVIHGAEDVDAAGLAPLEVVAAFASRGDIDIGQAEAYSIDGIEGLLVDMSTDQPDVKPFGGEAGDLQLDPAYEARTIIVTVDGAPLLVMVFGRLGELEEAWADSRPIVDSIDW